MIDTPRRITHLSVSAIQDWLECPMKWYATRILKLARPPFPPFAIGNAVQRALEAHHRGEDGLVELYRQHQAVLAEGAGESWIFPAQKAVEAYCDVTEPHEDDIVDQQKLKFYVRVPGLKVPIMGFYDMLRPTATPGVIHDWKTGASKWDQARADRELQPTVYYHGYRQQFGRWPEHFMYHCLYTAPWGKYPEYQIIVTERTSEQVQAFYTLAAEVLDGMQHAPILTTCKRNRCNFADHCKGESAAELVEEW